MSTEKPFDPTPPSLIGLAAILGELVGQLEAAKLIDPVAFDAKLDAMAIKLREIYKNESADIIVDYVKGITVETRGRSD